MIKNTLYNRFRRKAWGGKRLVSDLTCTDRCDPMGSKRGDMMSPGYGGVRNPAIFCDL